MAKPSMKEEEPDGVAVRRAYYEIGGSDDGQDNH